MRIRWTDSARRQLREIHDHIALDSKENARRMMGRFRKGVARLGDFPESGWKVEEYDHPLIREIVVGKYRVFYAIIQKVVRILAIHHGARRPPHADELLRD